MKLPRRNFLHLAAGAAALPALSRIAWAQAYPTRPVRWIVSFAAGGPNDIVARIVGHYLSDHLGQQFVIENRAGAAGNVGMQSALNIRALRFGMDCRHWAGPACFRHALAPAHQGNADLSPNGQPPRGTALAGPH